MTQSNNLYRFVKYDPANPPKDGKYWCKGSNGDEFEATFSVKFKKFSQSDVVEYLEPLPIPSSIEEEARKYADGNGFKIDPNDEMGESQASHKYIVDAVIAGSQLRPDTSRLREKIETILDLPQEEWEEGATYGDTKFDSPSAAYGYNMCLEYVKQIASEALNTSGEDKQDNTQTHNNG